ncbi:MAG: hypothetical protein WEG36_12165 [Gemmatimonadota bacterium]
MGFLVLPDDVLRLDVDGEAVTFWTWDTPALLARGRGDVVPLDPFPRYDRARHLPKEELRELWRAKREP